MAFKNNKYVVFSELYDTCRLATSGTQLSYSIRSRLERFSKEERREIVSRKIKGCSSFFLACFKGSHEIVKYLLEQCDADVEQWGKYEVPEDKSTIYAPPLWLAAVENKQNIVRCLVEHGANINGASDTGSTPVRAACFMVHYEVVNYLVENNADISKPNYYGGTCLINSVQSVPLCEFLILHGADVNAQDIHFKTALHYAIEEHSFETTKLLLDNEADPFVKTIHGDDALQTACLNSDTHIFEYLCEKFSYSKERIAEAHELLGSAFLEENKNLNKCLHHWRTALAIRYGGNQSDIIPKHSVCKAPYDYITEFDAVDELEDLAKDLNSMYIQSLLVRERILGPFHKEVILKLMFRGAVYADKHQYQHCINLWKYVLELRIEKHGLLHNIVCFTTESLLEIFFEFHENYADIVHEQFFSDVFQSICIMVCHFEDSMHHLRISPIFKEQQDNFDKILKLLTHYIYILYFIPKTPQEIISMKRLIGDVLQIKPRNSAGDTLHQLVISKLNTVDFLKTAIFPNIDVAELLLECGANVEI